MSRAKRNGRLSIVNKLDAKSGANRMDTPNTF